ncbi:unnamed protein product [Paramecium sonneborni]|uniref:RING-type domain-containing protein n=1 Tax=Paramecium sonneborni TaxID=65129 RepID=A0A8S1RG23_9CILI|nr:unnamed protein product [Paramecium sonneborni]
MIRQFEVLTLQQVNPHILCSICREVFYNPIRATCGHTFCGTCLVRWIQQKKSCPLCRHQLERNYKFDKDILASKIVGDIQVKCLRCQQWNGTLALFKQHKKTQCIFIQRHNEIPQNAIEIGDDDKEATFSFIIDTHKIIKPNLVQIDEQSNEQDDEDLEIQSIRQNNDIQNDNNSQVEINPLFINDQYNHIVIETQDNVLLEESNQYNDHHHINLEKSDKSNKSNKSIISIRSNRSIRSNKSNRSIRSIRQNIVQQQEQQMNSDDLQIVINEQENNQIKSCRNEQEIEILEPSLRILNTREIKELKQKRKFRINILRNAVSVAEPLIDSMNEDLFKEFIEYMKKEMQKKLNDINKMNTIIG